MLQIPTWSRVVTGLILFFGILIALPNALPQSVIAKFPHFLPTSTVTLGLDLQGGAELLLEVDFDQVFKEKIESLTGDIRVGLRKAHIGYRWLAPTSESVSIQILDAGRYADAKALLANLNGAVGGSLLGVGARDYDIIEQGSNVLVMKMTDTYKTTTLNGILGQEIEVVRRRIDSSARASLPSSGRATTASSCRCRAFSIRASDRRLLGKTARMTFQMVDEGASIEQAKKGIVPIGSELLPMDNPSPGRNRATRSWWKSMWWSRATG
jgi:preprotein translocase subunit SecD